MHLGPQRKKICSRVEFVVSGNYPIITDSIQKSLWMEPESMNGAAYLPEALCPE